MEVLLIAQCYAESDALATSRTMGAHTLLPSCSELQSIEAVQPRDGFIMQWRAPEGYGRPSSPSSKFEVTSDVRGSWRHELRTPCLRHSICRSYVLVIVAESDFLVSNGCQKKEVFASLWLIRRDDRNPDRIYFE